MKHCLQSNYSDYICKHAWIMSASIQSVLHLRACDCLRRPQNQKIIRKLCLDVFRAYIIFREMLPWLRAAEHFYHCQIMAQCL